MKGGPPTKGPCDGRYPPNRGQGKWRNQGEKFFPPAQGVGRAGGGNPQKFVNLSQQLFRTPQPQVQSETTVVFNARGLIGTVKDMDKGSGLKMILKSKYQEIEVQKNRSTKKDNTQPMGRTGRIFCLWTTSLA